MTKISLKLTISLIALILPLQLMLPIYALDTASIQTRAELNKTGVLAITEKISVQSTKPGRKWLNRILQDNRPGHSREVCGSIKVLEVLRIQADPHPGDKSHGRPIHRAAQRHKDAVIIRLPLEHEHTISHTAQSRTTPDDKSRAGSSSSTINTFLLRYELRDICDVRNHHPHFGWSITGSDWPIEIKDVSVELVLPSSLPEDGIQAHAFKEKHNQPLSDTAMIKRQGNALKITSKNIEPGTSLELLLDFKAGGVGSPGILEKMGWMAQDWHLLLTIPLLSIVLLFIYRQFLTRRSRAQIKANQILSPPANLRPAEIGTLWDQTCDVSDIAATMIDLSVRGYYTIREIPATGFFALTDRDYEFKKLSPPRQDVLLPHEEIFMEGIFGRSGTAYLSNVQGIFRQFIPQIENLIYDRLVDEGLLAKSPKKDQRAFLILGASLAFLGVAVLFFFGHEDFQKALSLGLIVSGIIVAASPGFVPIRTEQGKEIAAQVHEFADSLRSPSKETLDELLEKNPSLFHQLLPYAIVLGVFEKWSLACQHRVTEWPDWFQFTHLNHTEIPFKISDFSREVWIATKVATMTFTASPPREYSSHTVGKYGTRKEQEHDNFESDK